MIPKDAHRMTDDEIEDYRRDYNYEVGRVPLLKDCPNWVCEDDGNAFYGKTKKEAIKNADGFARFKARLGI